MLSSAKAHNTGGCYTSSQDSASAPARGNRPSPYLFNSQQSQCRNLKVDEGSRRVVLFVLVLGRVLPHGYRIYYCKQRSAWFAKKTGGKHIVGSFAAVRPHKFLADKGALPQPPRCLGLSSAQPSKWLFVFSITGLPFTFRGWSGRGYLTPGHQTFLPRCSG